MCAVSYQALESEESRFLFGFSFRLTLRTMDQKTIRQLHLTHHQILQRKKVRLSIDYKTSDLGNIWPNLRFGLRFCTLTKQIWQPETSRSSSDRLGKSLFDQPVYDGEMRTLEVPSQAPCISVQAQWPCWVKWGAGQPEEEGVGFQFEACLFEQLRDREHLYLFTMHTSHNTHNI